MRMCNISRRAWLRVIRTCTLGYSTTNEMDITNAKIHFSLAFEDNFISLQDYSIEKC